MTEALLVSSRVSVICATYSCGTPALQNILVSEGYRRRNEIRYVADIIAELVSGFEAATKRLDDVRDS